MAFLGNTDVDEARAMRRTMNFGSADRVDRSLAGFVNTKTD